MAVLVVVRQVHTHYDRITLVGRQLSRNLCLAGYQTFIVLCGDWRCIPKALPQIASQNFY